MLKNNAIKLLGVFLMQLAVLPAYADLLDELRPKPKQESVREIERGNKPRQHHVDPYLEEREKAKSELDTTSCKEKKFNSFHEEYGCISKIRESFYEAYPNRGTFEYSEKTYAGLSRHEAVEVRNALVKLMDGISYHPKPGNEDIELTVAQVKSEVMYIERYVLQVTPKEYGYHK